MLAGVGQAERTGALRIRKGIGGTEIVGEPPTVHTFPRKFLERELDGAVRVQLVVQADPQLTYAIEHVTKTGDLEGRLVDQSERPRPRRWWQRRRNRG